MLLHIFYGATLFSQVRRAVTIFHTIFLSEGSRAPAFQKEVCLKATPGTMTTRSHLHDTLKEFLTAERSTPSRCISDALVFEKYRDSLQSGSYATSLLLNVIY